MGRAAYPGPNVPFLLNGKLNPVWERWLAGLDTSATQDVALLPGNNIFTGVNTFVDAGAAILIPGASYVPASANANPNLYLRASGSQNPSITANNDGPRPTILAIELSKPDDINSVGIWIDSILTNPGSGTIRRTGLQVNQFCPPDNGGDTSCVLLVSTGAGNGLTSYKLYGNRPGGSHDYSNEASGYAAELGTSGGNYAVISIVGVGLGGVGPAGGAYQALLATPGAKGFIVSPNNGVFDQRVAYAVGLPILNAPDASKSFYVLLDGTVYAAKLLDLSAATAGQIKFPATANPSSDLNTLDRYAEVQSSAFTLTDASGAGLTITMNGSQSVRVGGRIDVQMDFAYPATADGTAAKLTGLPAACVGRGALAVGFASGTKAIGAVLLRSGLTTIEFFDGLGTTIKNSDLSGATVVLGGSYITG